MADSPRVSEATPPRPSIAARVSLTAAQVIRFTECLNPSGPMRCRECVGCELNKQIDDLRMPWRSTAEPFCGLCGEDDHTVADHKRRTKAFE